MLIDWAHRCSLTDFENITTLTNVIKGLTREVKGNSKPALRKYTVTDGGVSLPAVGEID